MVSDDACFEWDNINLKKGILNVTLNLKRIPGGDLMLDKPKTKSSVRSIKVLKAQKQRIVLEKEIVKEKWQREDFVFPSTIGTAMDPSNLMKHFRKLLKKARLPKIKFHDLRHTAASLILNKGVDVLVASQRLGHAQPNITLDVYGHLMPSMQNEAANIIDTLIAG